jgi:hypothetical protein
MDQKTFSIVAGVIFAAVALFHLVRIYMDWLARRRSAPPPPQPHRGHAACGAGSRTACWFRADWIMDNGMIRIWQPNTGVA